MRRAAVVVCCMCCCVCVVALLRGVATPFAVLGRSLSCGREAEAAPRSNQLARPTRHRRPNATATSSEPKRRSTQHTQKGANTTRREHKAGRRNSADKATVATTTHHAAAAINNKLYMLEHGSLRATRPVQRQRGLCRLLALRPSQCVLVLSPLRCSFFKQYC